MDVIQDKSMNQLHKLSNFVEELMEIIMILIEVYKKLPDTSVVVSASV